MKLLVTCAAVSMVLMFTAIPPATASDGFRPIFNGYNLDGWMADERFWRVREGQIIGTTTKENVAPEYLRLTWQQGDVDDFELLIRYRISGNPPDTSVHVRSSPTGHGVSCAVNMTAIPEFNTKEWNTCHITVRGSHMLARINGNIVQEGLVDALKSRDQGKIVLQMHGEQLGKMYISDVKLKRLPLSDDRKKAVFIAGEASHGYGAHEHRAGCMLLVRHLSECVPELLATLYVDGYPDDPTAFDNADVVVLYADGSGDHPLTPHLEDFGKAMERGTGLVVLHWALWMPPGQPSQQLRMWIGGNYEPHWSVHPHWIMRDPILASEHPITRGLKPFEIDDEWYFNLRFRDTMVTPILSAIPPPDTLTDDENPHARAAVAAGQSQHLAWAYERANGGRGFGFTGGHWHWNWGHPMQRRLVLNAIVWAAKAQVPEEGVAVPPLTMDDLKENQDYDPPESFCWTRWEKNLESWNNSFFDSD